MKTLTIRVVKRVAKVLGIGLLGGFLTLLVQFVLLLQSRPDLELWHEVMLDAEFTASSPEQSFEEYVTLEEQLFAQLRERIFDRVESKELDLVSRYRHGDLSNPGLWPTNWNRTFELPADSPRAGVLLLHGMSDSPYSLRHVGQSLHAQGAWVIGLRLPGHGTAPSGLVRMKWQDMAAAVRLSMHHLRDKVGDRPLYLVGYSVGGALSVQYAVTTLEDTSLPPVSKLVLISPAIGVTRMAALAVWQAQLGHLLGLQKLAWNSIKPEYDPFKYGSFAVNAGDQTYRLTSDIQSRMTALGATGDLDRFPPVLAFQSAVDATVSNSALVDGLLMRLPVDGHELVMFDVNRMTAVVPLLAKDPRPGIDAMLEDEKLPFTISLITNETDKTLSVAELSKKPGDAAVAQTPLAMEWPRDLYSLSHIALPFPANDPLYGGVISDEGPAITLGNTELRGERGALQISASDMLRLRRNPFYPYLEQRLLEFVQLAPTDDLRP